MLSYNRYKAMSDALIATGRPILYSMCNWGWIIPGIGRKLWLIAGACRATSMTASTDRMPDALVRLMIVGFLGSIALL